MHGGGGASAYKLTAEEAPAEAWQMEKKRKKSEINARYVAKVKDAGGKNGWKQQRKQRAEAAEEAPSGWKGSANARSTRRKTSLSLSLGLNRRRRKLCWKSGHSKLR